MKKLIFLFLIFGLSLAASASPPASPDGVVKNAAIYACDQVSPYMFSAFVPYLFVSVQDDVMPPATDPGDIFNIPGKNDPWQGWLNWALGIILLVVYEVLARVKRTSKSYSIIAFIYRLLSWFVKDKAIDDKHFAVRPMHPK